MMGIGVTELIIIITILVTVGTPVALVLFIACQVIRRNGENQVSREERRQFQENAGRLDDIEQRLDALETEARGQR